MDRAARRNRPRVGSRACLVVVVALALAVAASSTGARPARADDAALEPTDARAATDATNAIDVTEASPATESADDAGETTEALSSAWPSYRPSAADAACPTGMALVDGEACWDVQHTCVAPVPDDLAHRCLEFKSGPGADVCIPPKKHRRFCMDRYEWPGIPGVKPRVVVDYFEAERACKSVGKRMCEEQEFYLACEGPEHWPFAWGHVRHPSPCNVDRPYLTVDWDQWGKGGAPRLAEAARLDQALPIGTSRCFSPYGIHDLAGNVDEWTHAQEGRELLGSLNGGYWGPVANACRYVTLVHGPEFAFYQIGFRCCADPAP